MTDYARAASVFVNLGKRYNTTRIIKKRPPGWAYFEDGSVFIVPSTYLDHDAFELRMKMIAPFVSAPALRMQANRQSDALRKRLVVINNDRSISPGPMMRLVTRKVHDGEHITAAEIPFDHVTVSFDETTHEYIHSTIMGGSSLTLKQNSAVQNALRTFRGTYVDGTLQPNVRLGNGLAFLDIPTTMGAKPGPSQQQPVLRELELREAILEARARELDAREERLRLQEKAFELQQIVENEDIRSTGPNDRKYEPPQKRGSMIRWDPGNALADRAPTSASSGSPNNMIRWDPGNALADRAPTSASSGSPNNMIRWDPGNALADRAPTSATIQSIDTHDRIGSGSPNNMIRWDPGNALADRAPTSATTQSMDTHDRISSDSPNNMVASYSPSTASQLENPVAHSPAPATRQASAQFDAKSTDHYIPPNEPQNLMSSSPSRRPQSNSFPSSDLDTTPFTCSQTSTTCQASAQSPAETTDISSLTNEPQNLNANPSPRKPPSDMFSSLVFDTTPPPELANLRARRRKPTYNWTPTMRS